MFAPTIALPLLGLSVMVGFVTCQQCPDGWQNFKDSCYIYGRDAIPWGGAQAICADLHAKLAEIESMAENEFLKNIAKKNGDDHVWLGGTDMFYEGKWVWISTQHEILNFVDWAPGQPSTVSQDCLSLWKTDNYQWDDFDCTSLATFFCEMNSQGSPVG